MSAALEPGVRALVRVSAALAAGRRPALAAELRRAGAAAPPQAVEEALLQSYLFLGYPAALDAMRLWREISGREPPPAVKEDWESWVRRGEEVCARVYGRQYDALRRNVRSLHPDLERWMLAEGYGKVLARSGLELAERELCIVALLAVRGHEPQLHSHLQGALNAGATPAEVQAALDEALAFAAEAEERSARETWARVVGRWQGQQAR